MRTPAQEVSLHLKRVHLKKKEVENSITRRGKPRLVLALVTIGVEAAAGPSAAFRRAD
jgi:hypothetical protein